MRKGTLLNETEYGWSVDPSSPEQVIDARLRREEHIKTLVRKAMQDQPLRSKKSALGLSEAEIASIDWEASLGFLESARLPDELRERRAGFRDRYEERVEQFSKMPEALRDETLAREADLEAAVFARECQTAIARATGHFADMLTQAAIVRLGRKEFPLKLRAKLWTECLGFAMSLNPGLATQWVGRAWGTDPRESPLPHLHRLDSIEEQKKENRKFFEPFIRKFQARLRHASPAWLDEAERRITLRCLLSYAPGKREVPTDKSKQAVALLLTISPTLNAKQVCAKLDKRNEVAPESAPVPEPWRRKGSRSWIEAYDKLQNSVEVLISKVRKKAGIPSVANQL